MQISYSVDLQKTHLNPPPHPPLHPPFDLRCQWSQQLLMDGRFPVYDFRQVTYLFLNSYIEIYRDLWDSDLARVESTNSPETL